MFSNWTPFEPFSRCISRCISSASVGASVGASVCISRHGARLRWVGGIAMGGESLTLRKAGALVLLRVVDL